MKATVYKKEKQLSPQPNVSYYGPKHRTNPTIFLGNTISTEKPRHPHPRKYVGFSPSTKSIVGITELRSKEMKNVYESNSYNQKVAEQHFWTLLIEPQIQKRHKSTIHRQCHNATTKDLWFHHCFCTYNIDFPKLSLSY